LDKRIQKYSSKLSLTRTDSPDWKDRSLSGKPGEITSKKQFEELTSSLNKNIEYL
jgi:hypothetical protein